MDGCTGYGMQWVAGGLQGAGAQQQRIDNGIASVVTTTSLTASQLFRIGNDVHFCADITYANMQSLLKTLMEAEADSLAALDAVKEAVDKCPADKRKLVDLSTIAAKPIVLHLTTLGGVVHAALGMVDRIKRMKVPVHTVVAGYVASAGTLLSMCGAKRFITPSSFMMVHELRSGFWGKYSDTREHLGNMDKLMALIVRFYTTHSKLPEAGLQELLSRDRDWDADESLAHGLVDEVLR